MHKSGNTSGQKMSLKSAKFSQMSLVNVPVAALSSLGTLLEGGLRQIWFWPTPPYYNISFMHIIYPTSFCLSAPAELILTRQCCAN